MKTFNLSLLSPPQNTSFLDLPSSSSKMWISGGPGADNPPPDDGFFGGFTNSIITLFPRLNFKFGNLTQWKLIHDITTCALKFIFSKKETKPAKPLFTKRNWSIEPPYQILKAYPFFGASARASPPTQTEYQALEKALNEAMNSNKHETFMGRERLSKKFRTLLKLIEKNKDHLVHPRSASFNLLFTALSFENPDPTIVTAILEAKPELANAVDEWGFTPLHHLSFIKNEKIEELANIILQYQNNINAITHTTKGANTPLHAAISEGNTALTKILLNQPEIETNLEDMHGDTPLQTAIQTACVTGDTECLKLILEKDSDLNKENTSGKTPYFKLLEAFQWIESESEAIIKVFEMLLQKCPLDTSNGKLVDEMGCSAENRYPVWRSILFSENPPNDCWDFQLPGKANLFHLLAIAAPQNLFEDIKMFPQRYQSELLQPDVKGNSPLALLGKRIGLDIEFLTRLVQGNLFNPNSTPLEILSPSIEKQKWQEASSLAIYIHFKPEDEVVQKFEIAKKSIQKGIELHAFENLSEIINLDPSKSIENENLFEVAVRSKNWQIASALLCYDLPLNSISDEIRDDFTDYLIPLIDNAYEIKPWIKLSMRLGVEPPKTTNSKVLEAYKEACHHSRLKVMFALFPHLSQKDAVFGDLHGNSILHKLALSNKRSERLIYKFVISRCEPILNKYYEHPFHLALATQNKDFINSYLELKGSESLKPQDASKPSPSQFILNILEGKQMKVNEENKTYFEKELTFEGLNAFDLAFLMSNSRFSTSRSNRVEFLKTLMINGSSFSDSQGNFAHPFLIWIRVHLGYPYIAYLPPTKKGIVKPKINKLPSDNKRTQHLDNFKEFLTNFEIGEGFNSDVYWKVRGCLSSEVIEELGLNFGVLEFLDIHHESLFK